MIERTWNDGRDLPGDTVVVDSLVFLMAGAENLMIYSGSLTKRLARVMIKTKNPIMLKIAANNKLVRWSMVAY